MKYKWKYLVLAVLAMMVGVYWATANGGEGGGIPDPSERRLMSNGKRAGVFVEVAPLPKLETDKSEYLHIIATEFIDFEIQLAAECVKRWKLGPETGADQKEWEKDPVSFRYNVEDGIDTPSKIVIQKLRDWGVAVRDDTKAFGVGNTYRTKGRLYFLVDIKDPSLRIP